MRLLPLASTGTVVSSAWMRSAGEDMLADHVDQRHQRRCAPRADSVGQRRHVEIDAFGS